MRGADQDAAMDRAAACGGLTICAARMSCRWPGPTARRPSCLGGSRPSCIQLGAVQRPEAALATATRPGPAPDPGPTSIPRSTRAAGLTNRDMLKITAGTGRTPRYGGGSSTGPGPAVPGPQGVPGRQRRAGLRGQHPRRARPDRRHRPPARHRNPVRRSLYVGLTRDGSPTPRTSSPGTPRHPVICRYQQPPRNR